MSVVTISSRRKTQTKRKNRHAVAPLPEQEICLSVIENVNGKTLCFRQPFFLEAKRHDGTDCMTIEHPDLGIDVYGETLGELRNFVEAEILNLWQQVVMRDDQKLSPYFQKVKCNLLSVIYEETNGCS